MLLKNTSVDDFVRRIKEEQKKIILFGAGVIANTLVRYMCDEAELYRVLEYIVDNNQEKHGQDIVIGKKHMEIKPPDLLKKISLEKRVILITASHYYDILKQLEDMNLGNIECYILPIMCTTHLNMDNHGVIKTSDRPLIPKKIHYMWFGSEKLPKSLQVCLDSWKKYCPDYEIIRWDENNYDIDKCLYTKQAHAKKKWGFIPDYARIDILYEHGGIYMDTDVELLKSLDEMLYQEAFTSIEKWRIVNIGGCTGAVPKHPAIKKILNYRKNIPFILDNGQLNLMGSGYYDTIPFLESGYKMNGMNQTIEGMNIYGFDYFHAYDYMTAETVDTDNTFAIHHFNGGWLEKEQIAEREKAQKKYCDVINKCEV